MPIVEVEGQRFEFPDGTTDDVIGQSIRTFFGSQEAPDAVVANAPLAGSVDEPQIDPDILAKAQAARPELAGSQGSEVSRFIEPALTLATGVIAEPIAGLAGIAQSLNPFAEAGAGSEAVQATREALTVQPQTRQGIEGTQAVSETLAPIAEAVSGAEQFLGDAAFEATGSPAIAAAAATLPAATLELIGLKGGSQLARTARATPSAKVVRQAIVEAAPDIQALKSISRAVYKELDSSGVTMKPKVYQGMVDKIVKATRKQGLDPRTTPRAAGAIEVLRDTVGQAPTMTEIDTLRKVAQGVARNIDPTEAALGNKMISEIDDFLDGISPKALNTGDVPSAQISPKFKAARQLWGRARRAELIQEAILKAKDRASGFENGIRVELGKIVNNKKLAKFFPESERMAIRDVIRGNTSQNFAKLVGRFGFSEGRATNVLAALSGVGAGGIAGGGFGAFAVPAIGTVSRKIAQNLTRGRAEFIDAMTRAGTNGKKITEAYLTATPKAKRSAAQLSELLSDPTIDLADLFATKNAIVKESLEIAKGRRAIGAAAGLAASQVPQEQQ